MITLPKSVLDSLSDEHTTRQRRYRSNNPEYRERETQRIKSESSERAARAVADRQATQARRPFVAWDTEGTNVNATPFLFGNSEGDEISHPELGTAEMLDLILEVEERIPDAIHVIYGAEYDFNMMLRDLPVKNLMSLKTNGKTTWSGYRIEHIPRKWFVVAKDGISVKIFDVISFFACAFLDAIIDNSIGSAKQQSLVKKGKAGRSDFTFSDVGFIAKYFRTELVLLVELMDKLRDNFYRAGVFIHQWHGPGAVARYMLRQRGIKQVMNMPPDPVHAAARYAFAGGRFESLQVGRYDGKIWNADINSAYPYAATLLPNLARGEWVRTRYVDKATIDPTKYALYHIKYQKMNYHRSGLCLEPQPLFRRFHDDRVFWPNDVTGWYWAPEASLIKDNPLAEVLECWEFVHDNEKPFAWIGEYYDRRNMLKRIGDPMELVYKLGINSCYGQLAQRAGWRKGKPPPAFHQIENAGFITSVCRMMIHNAAMYAWERDALISIDTDGIFATCPIPASALENGTGDKLGQWKVTTLPGMLNWQSGVYWLPDGKQDSCKRCKDPRDVCPEWHLKKARGAPKGQIPYEKAMEALPELDDIQYVRNELIGYRWALANHRMQDWRYFKVKPRSLSFGGSTFSKRWHNPRGCRKCRGFRDTQMHDMTPQANGMGGSGGHSVMHTIPWEENDHKRPREFDKMKGDKVTDYDFDFIDV